MFIHFQRRFVSTRVASRIVDVQCEKCGCEYHFELRRTGVGEGTAHYGLGAKGAQASANESSKQQLLDRLSTDVEPVPCPKCHWVNEDLVEGFRRQTFGGRRFVAVVLGIVVLLFSFSCGWFFSTGHPDDRAAANFFLWQLPLATVTIVLLYCILQAWLMNRFEPNLTYPDPPGLPLGTPPALLRNLSTGGYVLASTVLPKGHSSEEVPSDRFEFHIGSHQMPTLCCLCLASADPNSAEKQKVQELEVSFPLCSLCRYQLFSKRLGIGLVIVGLLNVALPILAVYLNWIPGFEVWFWSLLSSPVTIIVAMMISGAMIQPVRILKSDARRGVLCLKFKDARFPSRILRAPANPIPKNVELLHSKGLLLEEMQATIEGKRLVGVCCEKCGCNYYYEIRQTGSAGAQIMNDDSTNARSKAIEKAQTDLERKLNLVTEPVPCPKCHWVNEKMALDYKRRCYSGCGALAICLAIFVCSISLVIAWYLSNGPAADRGAIPFFLVYCPSVMAGFTVLVLVACAVLRSRVDVNRYYPTPPELPPEVPPASIVDPVTGKLSNVKR